MKFFSMLLIISLKYCLSSVDIESIPSCLITLETTNGSQTCLFSSCWKYSDPLKLIQSSFNNEKCQINQLKLSFSNYEKLLDFIENQAQTDYLLQDFFIDTDQRINTIQIDVDYFDSSNAKDFLSFDMLSYLGGNQGKIHIFKLDIKTWKLNHLNSVIFLNQLVIFEQPFQKIHLKFLCNLDSNLVEWILYKENRIQEYSPCPTLIQIQSQNSSIRTNENKNYQKHYDNSISTMAKNKNNNYVYIAKILIPICLIILGIIFCIYYFVYFRRIRKGHNNYFDTPASESEQSNYE